MRGTIQRLLTPPSDFEPTNTRVLAVTADLCFYAGVISAASPSGLWAEWARSLWRAIDICRSKPVSIVIFDSNLPDIEWSGAFDRLAALPNSPRLVLAAPRVTEELWRNVLRHNGYDVVERAARSTDLRRSLRFACMSAAINS